MRNCSNCGYREHVEGRCESYLSPMCGAIVKHRFSCEYHRTSLERKVDNICGTSVEDAKYSVERADLETLMACLEKEKRKSLRRLIESRIKKLSDNALNAN